MREAYQTRYIPCKYRPAAFSSERVVEFHAKGAGDHFDFIPEQQKGGVLGYIEHILKPGRDGTLAPIIEADQSGIGFMKCKLISGEGELSHIAICNNHGNRLSSFLVPRENVIPEKALRHASESA